MKKTLLAVALALGTAASAAPAVAQTATTTEVTISPQQRTQIREYVTTQRTQSVAVPSGFELRVGATLPQNVEVHTFPANVGVRHRYVVMNNRTVLIDGDSRRIVQIIE